MQLLRYVLPRPVCASLHRLGTSTRGNAAILFALALVPVTFAIGPALDYAAVLSQQTRLQNATDSAALSIAQSAATLSANEISARGLSLVQAAMGASDATSLAVTASFDRSSYRTTVSATTTVPTKVMSLVGQPTVSIGRTSVAQAEQVTSSQEVTTTKKWAVCLMVTAPTAFHTLYASGPAKAAGATTWPAASSIAINNCMLQVNTAGWDAVETDQPNARITGSNSEFCFHGGYIHNVANHGLVTTTVSGLTPSNSYPPPSGVPASELASPGVWDTNCPVFADPLENTASPLASASCIAPGDTAVSSNRWLWPGRYCGNITISGGSVTFLPGFYQIDGVLTISGSSTVVNASNVTLYLNGPAANFDMSGGTVNLSPSTDASAGALAGVALYVNNTVAKANCAMSDGNPGGPASRSATSACINAITGGTLNYSGLAYFRYLAFWVSGAAQVTGTGASLIAEYVATDDTSNLTITGIDNAATAAQLAMMRDSQAGYTTTSTVTTTTQLVAKLVK